MSSNSWGIFAPFYIRYSTSSTNDTDYMMLFQSFIQVYQLDHKTKKACIKRIIENLIDDLSREIHVMAHVLLQKESEEPCRQPHRRKVQIWSIPCKLKSNGNWIDLRGLWAAVQSLVISSTINVPHIKHLYQVLDDKSSTKNKLLVQ